MRNKIVATAIVVASVFAGSVLAQARTTLRANVPFEFTVGKVKMPAGLYDIEAGLASNILVVGSREQKAWTMVLTTPVEITSNKIEPRLVFRRYGNEYFLAQVWSTADGAGRILPKSIFEKELSARSTAGPVETSIAVSAQ